jgi:hypothetical protein
MPKLFLSHASEDKKPFVRKLADSLRARGLEVWYDEYSLTVGDSLRRSIDRGLADCDTGIVVLSPAFFSKRWPQAELDALFSAEISGRTALLPIWHGLDHTELLKLSPLLADRVALRSSDGVQFITSAIATKLGIPEKHSCTELADLLLLQMNSDMYSEESTAAGCRYRFLQMNAFKEEYNRIFEAKVKDLTGGQIECFPPRLDDELELVKERLRRKHRLPENLYLTTDEPMRLEEGLELLKDIDLWTSGTLTPSESDKLVRYLDSFELDEFYILLGVPNFEISFRQSEFMRVALVEIGCAFNDEFKALEKTAMALSKLDLEDA